MSGETEEMTVDGKSVESAIIWADNPELAYFRSILKNGTDDNLASGDSLIGDSTVREMLEINGGSPLRRTGVRDTSGLSDAESNTVDNIYIEDGSTFAKKKTFSSVFDDGTIESEEDEDLFPPVLKKHQSQDQRLNSPNQNPNNGCESRDKPPPHRQPQCVFSPAQVNIPHDVYRLDPNEEVKEPPKIPGFIFVTDGHPSIVHTNPEKQSDQISKNKKQQKTKWCIPRSLVICLTLTVIVTATVLAVLVYRMKLRSSEFTSSSSQDQNNGSPFTSPTSPPTSEPSSLRANNRPQLATPTSYPSIAELDSNFIPTTAPSMKPSVSIPNGRQTFTPTIEPTFMILNPPPSTVVSTDSSEALTKSPTGLPTMMPSPSSSAISTNADTSSSCVSAIATDKTCYQNGENIQISFNNCEAEASDWIGIYRTSQGLSNLNQALTWLWTCGNRLCNDAVSSGEVIVDDASRRFGNFRAVLVRDDGSGVYALGNTFTISSRCNS